MATARLSAPSPAPLNLKKEVLRAVQGDPHSTGGRGAQLRREGTGLGQEPLCKQFRQLRYEETTGPCEALHRLRELCRQWLSPETRTKEQILELLVLEQFLTILPAELQARVREQHPESGEQAVAALEDLRPELGDAGQQADPGQAEEQKMLAGAVAWPKCEVPEPEEDQGEEARIENGDMVAETDSCGGVGSSGKASEPREPRCEDCPLGRQQVTSRGKPEDGCSACSACGAGAPRLSDLATPEGARTLGGLCESAACPGTGLLGRQETRPRERRHRGPECRKAFHRVSHLVRHQKIHLGEKPYPCKECGKVFGQNAGLSEHLRIHTGEKPFLCIHCGKTFRRSSHLNRHRRVHSREEPCECRECGRTFSPALLLTHNQRTHGRSGSHHCNECGKAFSLASDLIRHHRIHTTEKPFKCDICQKAFRLNSHLAQHVRIHNEEKPYECNECGEAFRQRSGLFQHQRYHHKDSVA
ncbi:zinc finger and SCAN domain-containing protein 26 [Suricata suricatta]|uniref:Zinc finger and SCAN domain containing 26 n=1 Tax=Suricata suricatta TaxID=37032 RepID=A0A673T7U7_SURSU|nr:zinc finger and SCAN domain-containing protein 26 [Suricata suricatta]